MKCEELLAALNEYVDGDLKGLVVVKDGPRVLLRDENGKVTWQAP